LRSSDNNLGRFSSLVTFRCHRHWFIEPNSIWWRIPKFLGHFSQTSYYVLIFIPITVGAYFVLRSSIYSKKYSCTQIPDPILNIITS
jgi:hypothetical protein